MTIKNPNKNNGLKILIETLKEKNIITDDDLKLKKESLKQNDNKKNKSI